MISCKEAEEICNKAQYNEATFWEKLKLWFHIFMCKICAQFTKENSKLTTLCQKADLKSLTEGEKAKMKHDLQDRL
ncbi:hypothetical protein K8352_13335 [Flavobacteriaceae bacterium F89]|uniref:Uncharacterized protein n=1 Tax=Cerina litoralis TaxID=2874477 RepID=A0AAE3EY52_9FLAO|nr:hypothetical protein [Cerina litoralis]MCG2461736.1 hypothetical protein [Cerina litoralis]